MTNQEMLEIAMRQSAEDMGGCREDFMAEENVVFPLKLGKEARKYLKEPITCNFVSYGNNIVATSIPETMEIVSAYTERFGALMREIINRNKVPFYCTAWSNVRSVRNAIKCGFVPAWVEMTAKPAAIVDEMNSRKL